MTFLELCQRVRQECAVSGTGPTAVTGQTGEMKRIVDWTADAYSQICMASTHWRFLRSSFTVNTVNNQEEYLPTACTDSNLSALIGSATVGKFAEWITDTFRIYLQSAGKAAEQNLWPRGYAWHRERYQFQTVSTGQPFEFSVRPHDKAILLGPKPNGVYVLYGDYYRSAPRLSANSDQHLLPERFEMAIVWRAVQSYAGYEGDGGLYQHATLEHGKYYGPLMIDQFPKVQLGDPLA